MIAVVGNAYRKQLFSPFVETRSFGNEYHFFVNSSWVFKKSTGTFLGSILRRARKLIISDAEGIRLLAHIDAPRNVPILLFCWNGADEISTWDLSSLKSFSNLKIAFLFSEEARRAKAQFNEATRFKFPILPKVIGTNFKYAVSYLGEVDIMESFKNENSKADAMLWQMAESFELDEKKVKAIDGITFERALFILKNRLRFQYALHLKKHFGKDMVLVGNDWKKYGLDALPADYNSRSRFKLYAHSKVCLDLLSKSSSEAHYPRSAEIVSHSHGLVQLKTFDSEEFLEGHSQERTFQNFSELKDKIDHFLSLSPRLLKEKGDDLRSRLAQKTKAYNSGFE